MSEWTFAELTDVTLVSEYTNGEDEEDEEDLAIKAEEVKIVNKKSEE